MTRPGPAPHSPGDPELWARVDRYLEEKLSPDDEPLRFALRESEQAGLPAIQVSATAGKLLHVLAASVGARRILEIGTLGGYSTIWLARALPADGQLVSLEYEPRHADVARRTVAHAGLEGRVAIIVGKALDSLPMLTERAPFDFTFIDADKANNANYFEWAVRLSRPGSLIVVDNVVRGGEVLKPGANPDIDGMRAVLDRIGTDRRVVGTAIQTVGVKGWDGFAIARVA